MQYKVCLIHCPQGATPYVIIVTEELEKTMNNPNTERIATEILSPYKHQSGLNRLLIPTYWPKDEAFLV